MYFLRCECPLLTQSGHPTWGPWPVLGRNRITRGTSSRVSVDAQFLKTLQRGHELVFRLERDSDALDYRAGTRSQSRNSVL
jgi:hypothetical protein